MRVHCSRLDLSLNTLNGSIPVGVSSMTSLGELYLNDNAFSGNMPSGYQNVASVLEYLDISNNPLMSGTVPTTISLLTSLWYGEAVAHLAEMAVVGLTCRYLLWLLLGRSTTATRPSRTPRRRIAGSQHCRTTGTGLFLCTFTLAVVRGGANPCRQQ